MSCNASFLDVVQTINDPDILENVGDGEYILNANLEVADGVTFAMTSNAGWSAIPKDCRCKWNNSLWKNTDKWCKNNILGFLQMRTLSNRTLMALSDVAICNLLQAKVLE